MGNTSVQRKKRSASSNSTRTVARSAVRQRNAREGDSTADEADVYVDLLFDDGLLYFVICNNGLLAAEQLQVKFDKPLFGCGNSDISKLGVFKRLAFVAPDKHIPVFLDDCRAFYARRQRALIKLTLSWRMNGKKFTRIVKHDMRAYADIPYIVQQPDNRRIGHLLP